MKVGEIRRMVGWLRKCGWCRKAAWIVAFGVVERSGLWVRRSDQL